MVDTDCTPISIFSSNSILGQFGVGGPGAYVLAELRSTFGPCLALARGFAGPPPEGGGLKVIPSPPWRRALNRTRLGRYFPESQASSRREFDRKAAALIPPCRLAVVENSTGLLTLRRARESGARIALKFNNHPFGLMRKDVEEEIRRWGGPPFFIDDALQEKTEAEAREADVVFAMSRLVLDGLEEDGVPRPRLRLARYGVDIERFLPALNPPSNFTVSFVGWLSLFKGFPYLVEGFREAAISGSTLLLHGGTGIAHYHQLVDRLRGEATVRVVHGPVEDTYRASSVTVLPSVSDAFGNVVPESMACGVPVIVSDRCGAAELVRDGVTGFVVPARDSGAIRDRLRQLHEDPELRLRMGAEAREDILRRPWSLFREDIRSILGDCLAGGE